MLHEYYFECSLCPIDLGRINEKLGKSFCKLLRNSWLNLKKTKKEQSGHNIIVKSVRVTNINEKESWPPLTRKYVPHVIDASLETNESKHKVIDIREMFLSALLLWSLLCFTGETTTTAFSGIKLRADLDVEGSIWL